MPFIKEEQKNIEDTCQCLEHNPPGFLYQRPGTYTWQCPSCGKTITYTIPLITNSILDKKDGDGGILL